ncbi:IAA-alanine resistance protein 1 [Mercurialis annua]|uniref:IAA-alanine resistance protein 1 n=1 Tax=Mercurialis annua TaxID=3986 RepID=UPI00215F116C|nr:IAA-alanine resistance protein 1 [Mercurialis annua]
MAFSKKQNHKNQIFFSSSLLLLLLLLHFTDLCIATAGGGCSHGHHHHHHHHHDEHDDELIQTKLPEELAEEEDMKLYGFSNHDHGHGHGHGHDHHDLNKLTGLGIWLHALGCSLLVSLASLICIVILPLLFIHGKPSKAVVDSLALFGAGAMLGDAFLHQLPHAFGGDHSHSHNHDSDHSHHAHTEDGHSHAHSLKDLSIGLSVLAGIVLFLIVEKVVRYIEHNSTGVHGWGHGHHHHHNKSIKKLKDDDADDVMQPQSLKETEGKGSDEVTDNTLNGDNSTEQEALLRKRKTTLNGKTGISGIESKDGSTDTTKSLTKKENAETQGSSNLVFGYLNLFSDGVHNFTDGMALGSAFLIYGSVGGWSRTLFLLAHELPQEIGDFGILVRSGFSVSKALFFNFLSALAALVGTALALLWGQDPGQSSLIEGFTAGGFIYISVAGVLAEMNSSSTTFRSSVIQIISLVLGMAVALCISLVE